MIARVMRGMMTQGNIAHRSGCFLMLQSLPGHRDPNRNTTGSCIRHHDPWKTDTRSYKFPLPFSRLFPANTPPAGNKREMKNCNADTRCSQYANLRLINHTTVSWSLNDIACCARDISRPYTKGGVYVNECSDFLSFLWLSCSAYRFEVCLLICQDSGQFEGLIRFNTYAIAQKYVTHLLSFFFFFFFARRI